MKKKIRLLRLRLIYEIGYYLFAIAVSASKKGYNQYIVRRYRVKKTIKEHKLVNVY